MAVEAEGEAGTSTAGVTAAVGALRRAVDAPSSLSATASSVKPARGAAVREDAPTPPNPTSPELTPSGTPRRAP